MQKEIEIKIKLNQDILNVLFNWLEVNATFVGSFNLTDYYLNNPDSSFYSKSSKSYIEALKFLRIRITDKDSFICFKKREVDDEQKTLSVSETETMVEDGNKILNILKYSGFSDSFELKKKRDVFLVDNQFEFAIDRFEKIGTFVEIELKNGIESVELGLKQIYDLLKKIGIKEFIQFDRGYLVMFLNPNYDFGHKIKL